MNASAQSELYSIKRELQNIINELDEIAWGLDHSFFNIGSEKAAGCVSKVAGKYRAAKRKLERIDTTRVTDEFAAAHAADGEE